MGSTTKHVKIYQCITPLCNAAVATPTARSPELHHPQPPYSIAIWRLRLISFSFLGMARCSVPSLNDACITACNSQHMQADAGMLRVASSRADDFGAYKWQAIRQRSMLRR
jgi:hypothetical protein